MQSAYLRSLAKLQEYHHYLLAPAHHGLMSYAIISGTAGSPAIGFPGGGALMPAFAITQRIEPRVRSGHGGADLRAALPSLPHDEVSSFGIKNSITDPGAFWSNKTVLAQVPVP